MKFINKISHYVSDYMAILILFVAVLALLCPASFGWISSKSINWLLGVVMFCMGMTLKPVDFKVVFTKPKAVLSGCFAQFFIMPLLAFLLCRVFHLPEEIAIGVILVGCCPGGTASNVITYLAKGDVALSIGMTTVSTLLAPFLTPLLTFLLAGKSIDVNMVTMFLSIVQVVIVPIALGLIVNHFFPDTSKKIGDILPMFSTLAIALIIGIVVAANSSRILSSGLIIIVVVMLHNILGLLLGYGIGTLLKVDKSKRSAIAIEVGMQNSGLATSLAATHFAIYPLATIPGAIFSVWHNFSGTIAAWIFRKGK